jgi:threonine synthase
VSAPAFPVPRASSPPAGPKSLGLGPHRLSCGHCGADYPPAPTAICDLCLGPLTPSYEPGRRLPGPGEIAACAPNLWRYREWLPFSGTPVLSLDTGCTPLVESAALARELGVARAWIKNDAVSHPTLSFKDRVVAVAINAAAAFGFDTVACASTGNLANAVAAHASRAGLQSWVFVPHDLEPAKLIATGVYGTRVVRIKGTYDDVNRLCSQVADRFGWAVVNVNLRSYYGEGSKTVAFEIAEQLGWRLPDAVVAPMAGGSLVSKLGTGFGEFLDAGLVSGPGPRMYGAQASGCAPIVELVERGGSALRPVVPHTIARSLAIGAPADGRKAAETITRSGGWAAGVSDPALREGIALLARTTGIFTETAGGVTVAAALELARAGRLTPKDEVVLCITGNGFKTPDAVPERLVESPVIAPRLAEVAKLANAAHYHNAGAA